MGKKNKIKKDESENKNPNQGEGGQQQPQAAQPQSSGQQGQQSARPQGQQVQQGGGRAQQSGSQGQAPQQQSYKPQQGGQPSQTKKQEDAWSLSSRGSGGGHLQGSGGFDGGRGGSSQRGAGDGGRGGYSQRGGGSDGGRGGFSQRGGGDGGRGGYSQRGGGDGGRGGYSQQGGGDGGRGGYSQRGGGDGGRGGYSQQGGGDGGRGGYSQRGGGDGGRGGYSQQGGGDGGRGGYSQRGGGDGGRGGYSQQGGGDGGRGGYSQRGGGDSGRGGYSQRGGGDGGRGGYSQRGGDGGRGGYSQRGGGDGGRGGYSQRGGADHGRGGYQQQSHFQAPTSGKPIEALKTTSPGCKQRGTLGKPGIVETNYLQLNLDKMPSTAYHYDVSIEPDRPKKLIRPAFELFNKQEFPNVQLAFDGSKNAYSVIQLPQDKLNKDVEVIVEPGVRQKTFKIVIKETMDMEVDLNSLRNYYKERVFDKPMRALQCLEVVLSNPCHSKGVRVGRSFYTKPDQTYDLDDGYELWFGLYQAAILGDLPFLNVDISHKSFPKQMGIVEYLNDVMRQDPSRGLQGRSYDQLNQFLRGLNIIYTPPSSFNAPPKLYKVNELKKTAIEQKFEMEDGKKISVADYFASKGYRLQFPNLPCLHVGSTMKSNFVPLEFCSIAPGQAIKGRDGQRQVQKMIRFAATSTDERKHKIMNLLRLFDHNIDMTIKQFGVQINPNFIGVPTRILNSPQIEYFKGEVVFPRGGSWRMNDNSKFILTQSSRTSADGHSWCIIFPARDRDVNMNQAVYLGDLILKVSNKLGMKLAQKFGKYDYTMIDRTMQDLKKEKYSLVFVILPFSGTTYAKVKQTAELKYGILTQCIKSSTVKSRCNFETVTNIMLKVNAKLNGANHKIHQKNEISLQKKKIMFLGADVTHPSPDQKHIPSVVGVAASHDEFGTRYNMQYRLQQPTNENIVDMEEICRHHLMVYKLYNKALPEHIIYYRDGVSDGQFPIVKQIELKAIQSACAKLQLKVKLTCIIVVKRHHTRFFPGPGGGSGKFNNVDPGTVVDRVIVHPNEVQFFMVSHQSIQGTAKPTRYNVIQDDANINIDELQALTYNLCHLFPRCNRVVSYPAPAYLAHLVAFRGRVYIEGDNVDVQNLSREYNNRLVHKDVMDGNPMYFV